MSFFKDLKEDIAQSVNELSESLDDGFMDSSEREVSSEPEINPENFTAETEIPTQEDADAIEEIPVLETPDTVPADFEIPERMPETDEALPEMEETPVAETPIEEIPIEESMEEETPVEPEAPAGELLAESETEVSNNDIKSEEETKMDALNEEAVVPAEAEEETQEVTVITKGTTINGGIKSDTSLVVKGTIEGDVECLGKLTITGRVAGNTIASEIYVNTPKLEGDINSRGIVKIDVGTVVLGNISCTSVLVSGAVKGNIEVNGPVIVDSTAVVKGDIKAKSIQINSGAVIDGHCSLQFADVDLDSFFA